MLHVLELRKMSNPRRIAQIGLLHIPPRLLLKCVSVSGHQRKSTSSHTIVENSTQIAFDAFEYLKEQISTPSNIVHLPETASFSMTST